MRISDWSSDVCSSDLLLETTDGPRTGDDLRSLVEHARRFRTLMTYAPRRYDQRLLEALSLTGGLDPAITTEDGRRAAAERLVAWYGDQAGRSEEHTSELQSLMRISYAVFCLKKKKNNKQQPIIYTQ